LRGHDVVFGKFAAAAVRSFTVLFAAFPVMSIPLLMGGVTGDEFWRVVLALAAGLLVSLAAGLFVSALSRGSLTAMGGTALLLANLTLVPLLAGGLWNLAATRWFAGGVGPLGLLLRAFDPGFRASAGGFGLAVAGVLIEALALLLGAGWLVSRNWRESGSAGGESWWGRATAPRFHPASSWNPNRLTVDPGRWLAERTLPGRRLIWCVVWAVAAVCFAAAALGGGAGFGVAIGLQFASFVLLLLWLAVLAPQSLNESRRTGALELLLCTPLTPRAIVLGQIETLVSYFSGPVLLATIGTTLFIVLGGGLGGGGRDFDRGVVLIPSMMVWLILFILQLYAVGYAGLWFGLTQPRPGQAAARTVLLVIVLPWVSMIVPVLGCVGIFGWPIFWQVWASRRLDQRFRAVVAGQFDHASPVLPGRRLA
jgi:hypothetical protein